MFKSYTPDKPPTKDDLDDFYLEPKGDERVLAEDEREMLMRALILGENILPRSTFMKDDSNKNMLSLIEPHFIQSLGEVLTFGAAKYAKNNWQLCEDRSRYKDALLRHIYAYLSGEVKDPESKLDHLAHAAFGLMCLQYFDNLKEPN